MFCKTLLFSFITNCHYSSYNGTVVLISDFERKEPRAKNTKSSVRLEFIEASEKALKELVGCRFDDKDILIVCLDGWSLANIMFLAQSAHILRVTGSFGS